MKHYAGAFGLLGFVAALVVGIIGEADLFSVLQSAAIWGGTLFVLGYLLGRTALILLSEAGVPELPDDLSAADRSVDGETSAEEEQGSEAEPADPPANGGLERTESKKQRDGSEDAPTEDRAPSGRESLQTEKSDRNKEEIDRSRGILSGSEPEQPIETDEASPASGALTPRPPESQGR